MLSSCLLSGLIIGSISTCVYALITDKKDKDQELDPDKKKDKKMDYLIILMQIMQHLKLHLQLTQKDL